jgi:hypothetical protein
VYRYFNAFTTLAYPKNVTITGTLCKIWSIGVGSGPDPIKNVLIRSDLDPQQCDWFAEKYGAEYAF